MVERIGSTYRSIPGTVWLPWSKQAARMDLPDWLRVSEVCIEMHRRAGPDPRHRQVLDVKFQGELARPQSINDELGSVANKLIHNDFYLAALWRHSTYLAAMFAWRQIQLQSPYKHGVHMEGRTK